MSTTPDPFIEALHDRRKGSSTGRVSPEYRDVVSATFELLHECKHQVNALVGNNPLNQFEGEIQEFSKNLWQDWRAVWSDASECLLEVKANPENLKAAKWYTENNLTRQLMEGPMWWQAYTKPRGYPGDYLAMKYIYDGDLCGTSAFGQVVHALGIHVGQFVVKRKDLMYQAIQEVAARCSNAEGITIVSLGCGPAREVVEFAQTHVAGTQPIKIVLVDQDNDALQFAGKAIEEALNQNPGKPNIEIQLTNMSVLRLMREINPAQLLGSSDLIYSAGLFDYFSDRTCCVLAARLYEALRPGGKLILGNMKAHTDMFWPLELIADWTLNYRTAENIITWSDKLEGAQISLQTESTGYDYLLSSLKPA
jgi:SAM-dependent methyltransferase